MAVKTEQELKALWIDGFIPDQENYADLFDTIFSIGNVSLLESLPFGETVAQTPDLGNIYLASPSIVKLSNGDLLISHDYVGSSNDTTGIYRSTDGGNNWVFVTDIVGMFWGKIFVYNNDVYIVGTSELNGAVAITKSTDNGANWSTPVNVIADQQIGWTSSANTILFKDGYLMCAHGLRFSNDFIAGNRLVFIWADLTDLMQPSNWGHTTPLAYDNTQFPIEIGSNGSDTKFPPVGGQLVSKGVLEGNVLEKPNGDVCILYRLEQTPNSNNAMFVDVNWDNVTPSNTTINPTHNYVEMYGGNVKFTVIDDRANSGKYWSVTNLNRYKHYADNRVEAFLISSSDLINWEVHSKVLGYDVNNTWESQIENLGVQYSDLFVDGNDLFVVTRTSSVAAGDWHDADLTTVLKITDFRNIPLSTFINGSLIIDENSERIEDVNGIGVIHDQSKYFNSPFTLTAENANKVQWLNGLVFDGTKYMKARHNKYLNPDNGFSVFAVVENLQSTAGLRILSKANGVNDIDTNDWSLSSEGLTIGDTYSSGFGDTQVGEDYILAGSFDSVNNDIYNYLNGANRGQASTVVGGAFNTDRVTKTNPYQNGNVADLFIGKRGVGSDIAFTSLVKAIHIIPSYMTPSEITAYTNGLNAIYNIF